MRRKIIDSPKTFDTEIKAEVELNEERWDMFIPPFLQIIQRRGECRPFRYFTTLGQMCNITVNVEHEDECNLKEIFAKKQIHKKCQTSDSRLV